MHSVTCTALVVINRHSYDTRRYLDYKEMRLILAHTFGDFNPGPVGSVACGRSYARVGEYLVK